MTALHIVGAFLALLWPQGSPARPVHAIAARQTTQSQENQPNPSPQQTSPPPQPPDQQEASGHSAPPQPTAASTPCSENSRPASSQPGPSQSGSTVQPDCKPQKSTGAGTKKHRRTHKTDLPAGPGPNKTVIRNGGTPEPTLDLSPRLSQQQASHQLDETNQRLAAADANLKRIVGRQLSASQQDTMKQIKTYMEQAKAAANGGDVQRAYNLAVKADLLSAELAGR